MQPKEVLQPYHFLNLISIFFFSNLSMLFLRLICLI